MHTLAERIMYTELLRQWATYWFWWSWMGSIAAGMLLAWRPRRPSRDDLFRTAGVILALVAGAVALQFYLLLEKAHADTFSSFMHFVTAFLPSAFGVIAFMLVDYGFGSRILELKPTLKVEKDEPPKRTDIRV